MRRVLFLQETCLKEFFELGIIDEIILEPVGGAHRDKDLCIQNIKLSIQKNLDELKLFDRDKIFSHRKNKFLSIGRKKGFVGKGSEEENLIMKEDFLIKIPKNIKEFKYQLLFLFCLIVAVLVFYLL